MKKKIAMLFSSVVFVFLLSGCQIAENNFQAIVASFVKPTTEQMTVEEPTTEEITEETTTTESDPSTEEPRETTKKKNDKTTTNQNSKKKNPVKKVNKSDNKKKEDDSDHTSDDTETDVTTEETTTETTTEAAAKVVSISYDGTFKDTYYTGEEAQYSKQEVTATYDDGTKKSIPFSECEISGFDTSSAGNKKVTITYSGKSVSLSYKVQEDVVTGLSVDGSMSFVPVGGSMDTSGLSVTVTYSSGKSGYIDVGACSVEGFDSSAAGNKKLTISYQGCSDQVSYSVKKLLIKGKKKVTTYDKDGERTDETESGLPSGVNIPVKQINSMDELLGYLGLGRDGADEVTLEGGSFPLTFTESKTTLTITIHYKKTEK